MRSVILFIFLGAIIPCFAQNSSLSILPVSNVEVTLKQSENGKLLAVTLSNSDGSFVFANLNDGKYLLEFSTMQNGIKVLQKDLNAEIEVTTIKDRKNNLMDHLLAKESNAFSVAIKISGGSVSGIVKTKSSTN